MIKAIKTKKQHESALEKIYNMMQKNLKPGSKEMDELEVLSILVERYEEEHYPIPPPDPIEAIKFRMEHMNLSRKELAKIVGYKSRVSELLSGKRKLSLSMIRRLNKELKIPAETLIQEY